jgi:hypothetical protein
MKKEANIQNEHAMEDFNPKKHKKKYVYPIRDWKEYLGESFLIVFSVFLALFLTEHINKLHEKENTKMLLRGISAELNHNKKAIQEMQAYDSMVFEKIDSALADKKIQKKLVSKDEFHLDVIAPHGIQYRFLDNDAWAIGKSNNIISKIDIETVSILTKVYENQDRIAKIEDEVAKVIFDRSSRDPRQVRKTLILIKDIYRGWVVDRVPGLLSQMDSAVVKIEKCQLNVPGKN